MYGEHLFFGSPKWPSRLELGTSPQPQEGQHSCAPRPAGAHHLMLELGGAAVWEQLSSKGWHWYQHHDNGAAVACLETCCELRSVHHLSLTTMNHHFGGQALETFMLRPHMWTTKRQSRRTTATSLKAFLHEHRVQVCYCDCNTASHTYFKEAAKRHGRCLPRSSRLHTAKSIVSGSALGSTSWLSPHQEHALDFYATDASN